VSGTAPPGPACAVCGNEAWRDHAILWPALVAEWQLAPHEHAYVDRQQGTLCTGCGANLRSAALARAILDARGATGTLRDFAASPAAAALDVLEINEAGMLGPTLRRMPGHRLATYPEVDMHALPYPDAAFDLVVHSDTLEHVPDPVHALTECRRVLRPGGALCLTVPTIVGRLTRGREGLPPSYHGDPATTSEDFAVRTEYGADAWTQLALAGFARIGIAVLDFPSATALTGWRDGA